MPDGNWSPEMSPISKSGKTKGPDPLAGLTPLTPSFFDRDPCEVGPDLLGKVLVRRHRNTLLMGRIVELEAYLGGADPAAHAFAGKTARNAVLFGPPGYAYVYFIYGNHYCLNVSCMPEGQAGCLLFRALEPLSGLRRMATLRGLHPDPQDPPLKLRLLTSGPGRLTQAMGITRAHDNGKDLTDDSGDLWIADDGYRPHKIVTTKRIGITKAASLPLRFYFQKSPFVSRKAG